MMGNSTASSQVMPDQKTKAFNWRTFEPSMLPQGMDTPLALELVTYRDKLDEMLDGHEGDFVVIKGDKIIGYHTDHEDAADEVFKKFGTEPALIKKVMELEPLLFLGRLV
jgi:hypothetical protein